MEINMIHSSGTLLYRQSPTGYEVLIIHPSGAYNRNAPWSIPKGFPEANEAIEDAARRETVEETGVVPGILDHLGTIDMSKTRKRIHCYYGEAPSDAMPKPTSWEVDVAKFVSVDEAKQLLHQDQKPFIDMLVQVLNKL